MRAIVQTGYGDPADVLAPAEVPRPVPGPDEVLVRLRATTVNTPDWITVLGEPWFVRVAGGLTRPRSRVRGTDVAGVVEQVGADVTDLAPGDEVFGSPWTSGIATAGTFCEYAVVPATMLARKPPELAWTDAAAIVMSGLVSLWFVRDVAALQEGMSVLVNGASGSLGTFMVQLAHLRGAEVTGVCSGRNAELVRSLGAAHVVDHTTTDLRDLDRRFDVVVDNVLTRPGKVMTRLVAPGGLFVPNSVGQGNRVLGGLPRIAWTTLRALVRPPRVTTIGYEVDPASLAHLAELVVSGQLRVVVDSTHALADVHRAVARMASHRARGNVAVTIP